MIGRIDRDKKIIALLPQYNMSEIGRIFGISRERVRQIVVSRGIKERDYSSHKTRQQIRQLRNANLELSAKLIAQKYNVSKNVIYNLRHKLGIKAKCHEIGCKRCKIDIYARDLCKNCYNKALRHGLLYAS